MLRAGPSGVQRVVPSGMDMDSISWAVNDETIPVVRGRARGGVVAMDVVALKASEETGGSAATSSTATTSKSIGAPPSVVYSAPASKASSLAGADGGHMDDGMQEVMQPRGKAPARGPPPKTPFRPTPETLKTPMTPAPPSKTAGTRSKPVSSGTGQDIAFPKAPKQASAMVVDSGYDDVMETDDWAADFDKQWEAAMAGGDVKVPQPPAKKHRGTVGKAESSAPATPPDRPAPWASRPGKAAPPKSGRQAAPKSPVGAPPSRRPGGAPTAPRQPTGPPPPSRYGGFPSAGGGGRVPKSPPLQPARAPGGEAKIAAEHPDWATRCSIEPKKPGQPQRMTISMSEIDFEDNDVVTWSEWMDRRLTSECIGGVPFHAGGKSRFKSSTIDFSENTITVQGVKALCGVLEKHGVRCETFVLSGNNIGNEGVRCIAKYLMATSQAPALELHLERNKFSMEGVKWLLASLSMHPAYPAWNNDTDRFVPLWLKVSNPKIRGDAAYAALAEACNSQPSCVCLGEQSGDARCGPRQCVNVGCCDELKHNCVAHLLGFEVPEYSEPLPAPIAHAKGFFAPAGRAAVKPPPSGIESPARDEPRVLYEDEDLAVVMKPPGWTCTPQPKGIDPSWAMLKPLARRKQVGDLMADATSPPPLQAWLLLQFGAEPANDAARDQANDRGLAHRLDVETSGPLLVGKTSKGLEHAKKQIVLGILKDYVCLVHGQFSTDRGVVNAPIDTSIFSETRRVRIAASGQPATTVWEVLAEYETPDRADRYTLLHCRMVTLRTHQVRIHFQNIGHPLVGDTLYGGSAPAWCPRVFLHKCRIGFFNTKGAACVEACSLRAAPDLWKALGGLRKVGGMAMMGCGAPGL